MDHICTGKRLPRFEVPAVDIDNPFYGFLTGLRHDELAKPHDVANGNATLGSGANGIAKESH